MPITNKHLVTMTASTAFLNSQDFVHTTKYWEALINIQKAWAKWKSSFHVAQHLSCKCQLLASSRAIYTHSDMHTVTLAGPSDCTLDCLHRFIGNLASA